MQYCLSSDHSPQSCCNRQQNAHTSNEMLSALHYPSQGNIQSMKCGVLHKQACYNTATCTEHFLCTVPHKILHNYTAYADSIQMQPFTSCEQSAQLGERPFSCEAICYTREIAIHPSVSDVIHHYLAFRTDILKNIISHYSLTDLETGSIALISPFAPQGGSTCLGQCNTSNCLLAAPHLQCLLT